MDWLVMLAVVGLALAAEWRWGPVVREAERHLHAD